MARRNYVCCFCATSNGIMVSGGPDPALRLHICQHCIERASALLAKQLGGQGRSRSFRSGGLPAAANPSEIKQFLDQYLVGQDEAKVVLSVAVANHFKRTQVAAHGSCSDPYAGIELDKSNVLLLGPTGVGKTEFARTIARFLNVPFAIGDATTLTAAGYVGEDVESLISKLLMAADFDVRSAQKGIVYLDEIDKIRLSRGNVSITRDVGGECVQQGLLKLLEGTVANVPPQGGRKHPEQSYIQVDTRNILFICGGAFDGLEEIIGRRLGRRQIGFNTEAVTKSEQGRSSLLRQVTPEDLIEFGMIPEFIGRLPVIAVLDDLDEKTLGRILVEPRNALLKQYERLCHLDGVRLSFSDDAVAEIAHQAKDVGTNARALRSVVEKVMTPILFRLSELDKSHEYVVDAEVVRGDPLKVKPAEPRRRRVAG